MFTGPAEPLPKWVRSVRRIHQSLGRRPASHPPVTHIRDLLDQCVHWLSTSKLVTPVLALLWTCHTGLSIQAFPSYSRKCGLFGHIVAVFREACQEVSTISRSKFSKHRSPPIDIKPISSGRYNWADSESRGLGAIWWRFDRLMVETSDKHSYLSGKQTVTPHITLAICAKTISLEEVT